MPLESNFGAQQFTPAALEPTEAIHDPEITDALLGKPRKKVKGSRVVTFNVCVLRILKIPRHHMRGEQNQTGEVSPNYARTRRSGR